MPKQLFTHLDFFRLIEVIKREMKKKWAGGNIKATIVLLSFLMDNLVETCCRLNQAESIADPANDLVLSCLEGVLKDFYFLLPRKKIKDFRKKIIRNLGRLEILLFKAQAEYQKLYKTTSVHRIVDAKTAELIYHLRDTDAIFLNETLFGNGVFIIELGAKFLTRRFWISYNPQEELYEIFLGEDKTIFKSDPKEMEKEIANSFVAITISNPNNQNKETLLQIASEIYIQLYTKQRSKN